MDELMQLWNRHTQKKDTQARETLIVRYVPLVKYVVARLGFKMPRSLERDDLVSYGIVGLIEAVDRFDPSYEVKFETYAINRIRGQIIDSLRSLDLLPRSVYRYAREIETALAELNQFLGRTPTDAEIAEHLDISLTDYHKRLKDANFAIISLDQAIVFGDGEKTTLYDALEDDSMIAPTEQLDKDEMKNQLVAALKKLPKREQLLVSLYYMDDLTMKEVGQVLGVSESRVSQMHAKTMLTLRGIINKNTEPNIVSYPGRNKYVSTYATAG